MLSVSCAECHKLALHSECQYSECHYAEWCGAFRIATVSRKEYFLCYFVAMYMLLSVIQSNIILMFV